MRNVSLGIQAVPWLTFLLAIPNLNNALSSSTQHNIVASGGIVLHF